VARPERLELPTPRSVVFRPSLRRPPLLYAISPEKPYIAAKIGISTPNGPAIFRLPTLPVSCQCPVRTTLPRTGCRDTDARH
jgi:hypothetical protein